MAGADQPPAASRYVLGVDIGTTYTAAAVHLLDEPRHDQERGGAGGRWHMLELGSRAVTIPSMVLIRADGVALIGEAAERRSLIEPTRTAREFKRRLGDSVPLLLGGSPFSAEALTAEVLRYTIALATERYGVAPHRLALSHPANWGPFKLDVLRAAVSLAGENPDRVTFISEPEAAALAYAAHDRPPHGAVVAVYDLGGGTFDVAVLQDAGNRYRLIGEPGGVERLGGIDFDEALFRHVLGLVEADVDLTSEDPPVIADLMALRNACVAAKEALSVETDTTVAVRLGAHRQEVRVVRSEFEALIRPTLQYTISALTHTLEEAGLTPADLHAVLLVGGSSRIPLVAQLVSAALARPVALDIHPKHVVALGAALVGAGAAPADQTEDPGRQSALLTNRGPEPAAASPTPPAPVPAQTTATATARLTGPASTEPASRARTSRPAPPDVGPTRLTRAATPSPAAPAPATRPAPAPMPAPANRAAAAPSQERQRGSAVTPASGGGATSDPPKAGGPDPARQAPAALAPSGPMPPPPGSRFATVTPPATSAGRLTTPARRPSDSSTTEIESDRLAVASTALAKPTPVSGSGRRRLAGVLVGAFAGLVALAGYLVLRDSNEVDPPASSANAKTATSVTSSGSAPATSAVSATVANKSARQTLREFADFANRTDGILLRTGNRADRVIPACRKALTDAETAFGAPPPTTPRVPASLVAALNSFGGGTDGVLGKLIDTFYRRLQACIDGNQDLYDQLQIEEGALRDQLPDL